MFECRSLVKMNNAQFLIYLKNIHSEKSAIYPLLHT